MVSNGASSPMGPSALFRNELLLHFLDSCEIMVLQDQSTQIVIDLLTPTTMRVFDDKPPLVRE